MSLLWLSPLSVLGTENDAAIPAWQRGVSRWNGSGYDLPATTVTTLPSSPAAPAPAPYTVPVDPKASSRSNPYFNVPAIDDNAPLALTPATEPSNGTGDVSVGLPTIRPPEKTSSTKPRSPMPLGGENFTSSTTQPAAREVPTPNVIPAVSPNAEASALDAEADAKKRVDPTSDGDSETAAAATMETLSEQMATGEGAVEPAPLESEVIRWYQYPQRWMRGWDSHAELGLDGSNGNADTLAIQTGLELVRKTERNTFEIDVNYRQASNRDTVTEDNGRLDIRNDRLFENSRWSSFGEFGMQWDRFKAFNLRLVANGGVGYHWIRREDASLVTRFGAGGNKEIGAPDDDWVSEAVFGIDAERQLTSRQKLKGRVDYFPAWEDFTEYRLVCDFAWEILLDGSDNLSLKLAANNQYDSTPQGAKANDIYYSLLLLYKF